MRRGRAHRASMRFACFSMPAGVGSSPFFAAANSASSRHGVPQEIGEAAGHAILFRRAIRAAFQVKQEVRRLQHRLHHHLRARIEILVARGFAFEKLIVGVGFGFRQRSAKCALAEMADEFFAAGGICGTAGLAGDEAARIATEKRGAGGFLGRAVVRFGQQRRNALRVHLVGEAVNEIFAGKLIGGPGLIAQQIAQSVVVLAVRQAAEHERRFSTLRLRRFRN